LVLMRKLICTDATPSSRGAIRRTTSRTSGSFSPSVSSYLRPGRRRRAGNWINPCMAAPMTTPSARPLTPIEGTRKRTPRILPSEYMQGARAGRMNRWCELMIPINSPLIPKITGAASCMRSSLTVNSSTCASWANPGASTAFTSQGAKTAERLVKITRMRVTQLATAEASFQAVMRSSRASRVVNVGMNADARAPPATRL